MTSAVAIKKFLERPDQFTTDGGPGRKMETRELAALNSTERVELGKLACIELGETWESPNAS